jgi:RNA polymerase sigma-70 factor (ECF subfamily)
MDPSGPEVTLLSPAVPAGKSHWQVDAADAARATRGDMRAFERLYRAHAGRIHGLACRMLSSAEAAEATQDVFVRAWQKLGSFRGEAAFGTWLHRLAVNVFLGRRQVSKLDRERHVDDDTVLDTLPGRARSSDITVDVEAAITRLPPGARQVFVLHDVEGYRHEEIAEFLGVTTGTTKAQLHRARMLLRGHLNAGEPR